MFEHFDPDAPAEHDGLFGLPHARHDARVLVVPVPMDATTSFGQGTAHAPSAVLTASHQVDLSLPEFGDPWRAGIAMDAAPPGVESDCALAAANAPLARKGDTGALHRVNAASERIAHALYEWTNGVLTIRQIPAVLGGDHSVPLGAIRAAASHQPGLGILHIDAHADLREAYEGFEQSHASIMYNVLQDTNVANILQIGLRDVGQREREFAEREDRLRWLTDAEIRRRTHRGEPMSEILLDGLQHLPETLWISFDVDGLDPSLCPGTGTPVPGGLSWHEAITLLELVASTGRRVVGFDLCEVGTSPWDANVGARLLYTLCGLAVMSQGDRHERS